MSQSGITPWPSPGDEAPKPRKKLSIDDLTVTANEQKAAIEGLQRKMAVHAFRAGAALHAILKMLKSAGAWCQWQRDNKWNRGTASRYIALFKGAKDEAALGEMTITEGEDRFCGKKPKVKKKSTSTESVEGHAEREQKSPTIEARELLASAYETLAVFQHGERKPDPKELGELKTIADRLLSLIAELGAK